MNKSIQTIKSLRQHLLNTTTDLTIDQLNAIPANFSNNIIWNMGHVIASQQGVCYRRSGVDLVVDDDFFSRYKPGTIPEGPVGEAEVELIKSLLITTIDQLEADYANQMFPNTYLSVVTRYGIELNGIDSGIDFLPFHEGLHLGAILAIKKAVVL